MKNSLRCILAAAAIVATAFFALPLQANHFHGAELTYSCIAPNTYVVNLKLYRDCNGTVFIPSATLNLRSQACNNGRTQAMTLVGTSTGNPYCPQVGNGCSSAARPNYEEVNFATTLSFTAAEAQCSDWTLSWSDCCRPISGNIPSSTTGNLYAEAFLRLSPPGTSLNNLNNSSPQFNKLVTATVNRYQPVVLSSNVIETDGDSLVYSLQPALTDATSPVTYGSFNSQNNILINPQDSTQIAFVPAGQVAFSATYPLPSYQVDWSRPAPRYATPKFLLDPHNGSLMFTPTVYHQNSPGSEMNKYVVVVQVDEYRKVNGSVIKVGSVRRDMYFLVADSGPNRNPILTSQVANGQMLGPNSIINLRPGTPLTLTFGTADFNQSNFLQLHSDVSAVLPGATFTKTTGTRPAGTVTWIPTAADVRSQVYYFRVMVEDNACPVKGHHVETIGVRVTNTGGVTGIAKDLTNQSSVIAFPNPFSGEVTFKIKQTLPVQNLLIYNMLGQQIDQLTVTGQLNTEQEVTWLKASEFPAGQYIVRFSGAIGQSLKISKLQ